jgi:indoleamine 2,3-dioxygenase
MGLPPTATCSALNLWNFEAQGAGIIPVMLKAMAAVRANNFHIVLATLVKFGYCVWEIGVILRRMDERCAPELFYHGVFFDEGEGKGERWQ